MTSKEYKTQFIYGLFSLATIGTCLTTFMLLMNILAFYLPLGVDNQYFRNKSPYQICNNLDARDYEKPKNVNIEECIKILTKENQETEDQTRKTNLTASSIGLVISLTLGFICYKVIQKYDSKTTI